MSTHQQKTKAPRGIDQFNRQRKGKENKDINKVTVKEGMLEAISYNKRESELRIMPICHSCQAVPIQTKDSWSRQIAVEGHFFHYLSTYTKIEWDREQSGNKGLRRNQNTHSYLFRSEPPCVTFLVDQYYCLQAIGMMEQLEVTTRCDNDKPTGTSCLGHFLPVFQGEGDWQ